MTNAPTTSRVASPLRTLALLVGCVISSGLLLLGLLAAWTSILRVAGLMPLPPDVELRWQTTAMGFVFAAACFVVSAALAYFSVNRWWPDRTPRGLSRLQESVPLKPPPGVSSS